jgi:hypothetical protein
MVEPERLNQLDIDTRWGFRSLEVWHGDITKLNFPKEFTANSVSPVAFLTSRCGRCASLRNRLNDAADLPADARNTGLCKW